MYRFRENNDRKVWSDLFWFAKDQHWVEIK